MQATDPSTMKWWQKAIVYQVYPRSFQDANGDGIGDIQGIISKVDHFVDIGVGAVWLSPFYPSPQLDFGYDVSDYCNVDPMFGTLDDFDQLVKALHNRDVKIIVDFVPGHTSHLHPWFQRSVKKEEPYTDYYVWHDGNVDKNGKRVPPNNWLSVFGGSSWTWNEERQQYYFRPFLREQPKLNFRCPSVVAEMEKVLRFWLDRGVDGFRMDAIEVLVEAEDKSLDEPINPKETSRPDQYEYLSHIHTSLQPEIFELTRQWADILEEFNSNGHDTFMVIEIYGQPKDRNRFRHAGGIPFNMDLINVLEQTDISGDNIKAIVDAEYSNLLNGQWPSFVLGNHDNSRIADRHGVMYTDAFNILLLTLKGTPTTYYGEEIGMVNIQVSYGKTQDPFGKNMGPERYQIFSRDPERSPMQWDSSPNAGFTISDQSWLPTAPDYNIRNVKAQASADGPSTLKLYKTLAKLRQESAFQSGSLYYGVVNSEIFSYVREDPSTSVRYLVALNFGKQVFTGDLGPAPVSASQGSLVASTCSIGSSMSCGTKVALDDVTLKPGDGLVVRIDA